MHEDDVDRNAVQPFSAAPNRVFREYNGGGMQVKSSLVSVVLHD
jgi:hypothetical protein